VTAEVRRSACGVVQLIHTFDRLHQEEEISREKEKERKKGKK